MDNDRHLVAPQFHVGVSLHDVDSLRQDRHIIQVWGMCHDVQSMIHHHCSLSTAMYNDRFKGWHHTLTGEGDGFIQIDRILAGVGRESLFWLQL